MQHQPGMPVEHIEGVPYYRFRVRYKLKDGRRRQITRRSPGFPWVREEIARELDAMHGIENIAPRSVTIDEV